MSRENRNLAHETIQINGTGLLSKDEVTVSISKGQKGSGIKFVVNNKEIPANVSYVSSTTRNTVLMKDNSTICLVEHFLGACSLLGTDDIEVTTNKSELVFNDGSALHWYKLLPNFNLTSKIKKKYFLNEPVFIKLDDKVLAALPHDGFKVSYFMDYNHPAIGKLFASWDESDDAIKLMRARTFATKEENDFFGVSDKLLTLLNDSFNMELYEPLEPAYHKILDIIGDLRLSGVNPLEINMHVFGYKSGHAMNIEFAKILFSHLSPLGSQLFS